VPFLSLFVISIHEGEFSPNTMSCLSNPFSNLTQLTVSYVSYASIGSFFFDPERDLLSKEANRIDAKISMKKLSISSTNSLFT
jgi:hypothetical protein